LTVASTPYVSDSFGAMHSSGTEAFDTQGGQDEQVLRAKLLWKASDTVTPMVSADWTRTDHFCGCGRIKGGWSVCVLPFRQRSNRMLRPASELRNSMEHERQRE
jgi:hypothetical protein